MPHFKAILTHIFTQVSYVRLHTNTNIFPYKKVRFKFRFARSSTRSHFNPQVHWVLRAYSLRFAVYEATTTRVSSHARGSYWATQDLNICCGCLSRAVSGNYSVYMPSWLYVLPELSDVLFGFLSFF
jgi:hypothetical protein